ncbi:VOC family protein [Thalassotalea mangrovi]|uniref:Glyoxalase-like domain-containing protein n=1 Tax=Thalassotalea mangrovi TaxID=2572245 RepID=A0A4U1B3M3_9GAMM|nr:VOC family protein [Thalassotalea mangrovi]TKB44381.1 hypothetical protein E8M12_12065 [Thalassotalea mangrovi]
MNKLPRNGVIIYAREINSLSRFYAEMFDMNVLRETAEFISIGSQEFNIVVHIPPTEMPDYTFNRVKMFITVDNLDKARDRVVELGGSTLEGEWSNPVFSVCNVVDPEGNHIQLREFKR